MVPVDSARFWHRLDGLTWDQLGHKQEREGACGGRRYNVGDAMGPQTPPPARAPRQPHKAAACGRDSGWAGPRLSSDKARFGVLLCVLAAAEVDIGLEWTGALEVCSVVYMQPQTRAVTYSM